MLRQRWTPRVVSQLLTEGKRLHCDGKLEKSDCWMKMKTHPPLLFHLRFSSFPSARREEWGVSGWRRRRRRPKQNKKNETRRRRRRRRRKRRRKGRRRWWSIRQDFEGLIELEARTNKTQQGGGGREVEVAVGVGMQQICPTLKTRRGGGGPNPLFGHQATNSFPALQNRIYKKKKREKERKKRTNIYIHPSIYKYLHQYINI